MVTKPEGDCPPGFIEKVRDRCTAEGMVFLVPKVRTRELEVENDK